MESVISQGFFSSAQPLVYIVVLNWNGWRDTMDCIASLNGLTYPHHRIVIVDNASTDDSVQRIQEACLAHPQIDLVTSDKNLGYAGGNNTGIRHALQRDAAFVWILNNDTIVDPDALTKLVEAMSDHTIAAAGSKIFYYDVQPDTIWFAGSKLDTRTGMTSHEGGNQPDGSQFGIDHDTEFLSGCSMLVRAEPLRSVGLLDERLFLYYEESDFCARLQAQGLRVRQVQSSLVWHKCSQSVIRIGPSRQYYFSRNRLLFMRQHLPSRYLRSIINHQLWDTLKLLVKMVVRPHRRQEYVIELQVNIWSLWDFFVGKFGECSHTFQVDGIQKL